MPMYVYAVSTHPAALPFLSDLALSHKCMLSPVLHGLIETRVVVVVRHDNICKPDDVHSIFGMALKLSCSLGVSHEKHCCTWYPANVAWEAVDGSCGPNIGRAFWSVTGYLASSDKRKYFLFFKLITALIAVAKCVDLWDMVAVTCFVQPCVGNVKSFCGCITEWHRCGMGIGGEPIDMQISIKKNTDKRHKEDTL